MTAATATLRPVGEGERTVLLDVLRGFALLGIVLVNFQGSVGTTMPRIDGFVISFLDHAVYGSFYPLFSFLFGVGFGVQLLRARERGRGVALIYLRRMLVLFLIGTVHAVFIFPRDILWTYAFFGLLLVPLGKLPDRAILGLILLLAPLQVSGRPVRDAITNWQGVDVQAEYLRVIARVEVLRIEEDRRRANDGEFTYAAAVAGNWSRYTRAIYSSRRLERILLSDIPLLFLIGMYAGRRRVFESAAARRRGFMVLGAASALAIALGHGYTAMELDWGGPASWLSWSSLSWTATDKGPTVLYIALITLLFTSFRAAARALSVFAAPGRMALTSYLTQTVVITLLFAPYGLGLAALATTMKLLFCLAFFFLFQVPVSHWWLARYQYGPAEWLWRSATYGAAQPMRRRPVPEAAVDVPAPLVAAGAGQD
jgi:uncharacterized protein